MNIEQAQNDMQQAYFDGGPGMLVSGVVWLVAAVVGSVFTVKASVLTLFFGGMLIHPLGVLLDKMFKRSGQHTKGNPLASLAFENTVLLFIGLFIAFVVLQVQASWFYPIMLLTIGGRYLTFNTLYGLRVYWLIGGLLAVAGVLCVILKAPFIWGAYLGALIEIMGSVWLLKKSR